MDDSREGGFLALKVGIVGVEVVDFEVVAEVFEAVFDVADSVEPVGGVGEDLSFVSVVAKEVFVRERPGATDAGPENFEELVIEPFLGFCILGDGSSDDGEDVAGGVENMRIVGGL